MRYAPAIELNDGAHIPQLGLGVLQIEPEDTAAAVWAALQIGYRHIDTAQLYGNEKQVGQGIRKAGLDRADVFITSKLHTDCHRPDDARRAFDETLRALQSHYVDLFLIHWPLPTLYDGDFVSTWHVLEEFAADGRARSIGVSNFQPAHLDRLAKESETVPAVNQVEVHPYFTNETVRAYNREHGIATEAWSPLAQGMVLDDPVIKRIAHERGKTPAQVVLRWHIRRGDIVFPKSVSPGRLMSNFEVFDVDLDDAEMDAIAARNKGEYGRTGPHPDVYAAAIPGPVSAAPLSTSETVRRLRYNCAIRSARGALLDGDVQGAKAAVGEAYRCQHTMRSAALLVALRISPRMLRAIHPAKNRAQNALRRAQLTHPHRRSSSPITAR